MARRLKFFALALLLSSIICLSEAQAVEIYRAGGIEFRLYDSVEELQRDLPPLTQATFQAIHLRVKGWADGPNKTIYSIKDFCMLIHELKHLLEPEWSHSLTQTDACAEVRIK